jgi:hypothetical protein
MRIKVDNIDWTGTFESANGWKGDGMVATDQDRQRF